MNNRTLDQKSPVGTCKVAKSPANIQRKSHTAIHKGSIMERLSDLFLSLEEEFFGSLEELKELKEFFIVP